MKRYSLVVIEMVRVYGRTLPGKQVMTVDGAVIGKLVDVQVEMETGILKCFLVKPDPGAEVDMFEKGEGCVVIPAKLVRSIKDYIVVDTKAGEESHEV